MSWVLKCRLLFASILVFGSFTLLTGCDVSVPFIQSSSTPSAPGSSGAAYGSVSFKPILVPLTFTIDTNGTISVSGDTSIVTPLGEISLQAGYAIPMMC